MAELSEEVMALLELIDPQNEVLVTGWAEALHAAGGIYGTMGVEGREALARGTIQLLRPSFLFGSAVPAEVARRFVDAPVYRHQPLDEFVRAGMSVNHAVRNYLSEHAPSVEVAQLAAGRVAPAIAGATAAVVKLRQARVGAADLVADIGRLFTHEPSYGAALDASMVRIADAFGAANCLLLCAGELDDFSMVACGRRRIRGAPWREGVHFTWPTVRAIDKPTSWPLDGAIDPVDVCLVQAGFEGGLACPLRNLGEVVGYLVVLFTKVSEAKMAAAAPLEGVAPLLASQIAMARQTGALEQTAAALDELFDASPNMSCIVDRVGRIKRTNARFRAEIGVAGDVLGMPISWLVHPNWLDRFMDLWAEVQDGESIEHARVDLITASSGRLSLALEAHWIEDGFTPPRSCMIALWDVRRHEERAAKQEQRIDELTAFIHHIAHDLKAPMRAVAGLTSIMLEDLPEPVDPELKEIGERAVEAALRGGALVDGLLRFARCTDLAESSEVVTLGALLKAAQVELAPLIEATGGEVVVIEEMTPLLGDRAALGAIVVNLVSNALRYAGPGARVEVSVRITGPGWASLVVKDDGPGIDPLDQERVFKLFARGRTKAPGTGVGLAVVRRIAKVHGGNVTLASEVGEGCTFSVGLPRP